ncbi:MAG TPA: hypothetical protein VEB43_14370 [Anaeromyxobacter sp.]|nr:hypothetical protein [Anaeromyxobacter sp.]
MRLRPPVHLLAAAVTTLALALAACSRGDVAARNRLFAHAEGDDAQAAFDPEHPERALALDADEVAERLGAFQWSGAVEWSIDRPAGAPLHVTEQHAVRQSTSGAFEVRADVDPGLGPHAVTGKHVIWVDGMTYARALPAPFRQRPTDRGRDARRYREDSFGVVRTVAALVGPALRLEPAGAGEVLGREVRRYKFTLGEGAPRGEAAAPAGFQAQDPDTMLRQGFLAGARATKAEGELELDAATGAPLRARLTASFEAPPAGKAAPPKVTVTVSTKVAALGGEVKVVSPPAGALPDERKPAGPSAALEAAGLKKRGEERPAPEPSGEGE